MSRECLHQYEIEDRWMDEHSCRFKVEVATTMTIWVDGYDNEDEDDLDDRVDTAIEEVCEVLYHDKRTTYFSNLERDYQYKVDIKEIE